MRRLRYASLFPSASWPVELGGHRWHSVAAVAALPWPSLWPCVVDLILHTRHAWCSIAPAPSIVGSQALRLLGSYHAHAPHLHTFVPSRCHRDPMRPPARITVAVTVAVTFTRTFTRTSHLRARRVVSSTDTIPKKARRHAA